MTGSGKDRSSEVGMRKWEIGIRKWELFDFGFEIPDCGFQIEKETARSTDSIT
jgi:hypothetical protein